jgi:hypothetical protein
MAVGPLAGCATLANGALKVKAQENGQQVGLLPMNLDHATPDLRIYEGDVEIPISQVRDPTFANAFKNALREAAARGAAAHSPTCVGVCTYSWTETTQFGPGVFLNPKRPHTLRLVRGDRQATVTLKTSFRVKWYFLDMVFFPLAPVAWVVDGVTGSWKEFSRLDVDRAFRNATASAAGATR